MKRMSLATLALVALCVHARGETIYITMKAANGVNVADLPATFDAHVGFPRKGVYEWQLADLTTDDLDTWFVLDDSTAASYGFTSMAAVNEEFVDGGLDWFYSWIADDGSKIAGNPDAENNLEHFTYFVNFEVQSIAFRVTTSAIDPLKLSREWRMAIVVPEPSLVVFVFACLFAHRLPRRVL